MNERQERFCELVASGMAQGRAYEQAGYDAKGVVADKAASRLVTNVEISNRIEELRAENRRLSSMTRAQAIDFLCEVVGKPIGEIDPNSRLAQEYQEAGEHTGSKIKMPGKIDAIRELAKMCGWYEPEKKEIGVTDELASLMREIRGRE